MRRTLGRIGIARCQLKDEKEYDFRRTALTQRDTGAILGDNDGLRRNLLSLNLKIVLSVDQGVLA
ncbi:hypothetical protein Kisp01_20640 [Kineosporia sp. NBRC 101677]|nr:hypothetical protein Kisp01_20640 [Kineosporia sp. NBRC 101677]